MLFDKDTKRFLISFFILLNILTVLYVNRLIPVNEIQGNKLKEILHSPYKPSEVSKITQFITNYGELVGLGTRWLMFILQDRYNWSYVIKAKYSDLSEIVLPIPRQGVRTALQKNLFDFKDAKFQYNFNYRPYIKEHYASYLCRKYSVHNGSKIKSVIFELYKQNILDPEEAEKRGTHLEPIIRKEIAGVYSCNSEALQ